MAIRPGLLVITLLFLPVMAFGQSYEWSDRLTGQALWTSGYNWQVVASEHGIYSVGDMDCEFACTGRLSKFRAADGKLLWRRKLVLESITSRQFGCRQRSRRVRCRELLE